MKIILAFVLIALTVLCTSIVAQQYSADYWLQKGKEFYKNNSYDLSLRCYDKSIEINPKNADAWNNKGVVLKELGRNSEAEDAFAKSRELGYNIAATATRPVTTTNVPIPSQATVPVHMSVAKQETVSMGPYNVSFDLGTVSHTIEVRSPDHRGNYGGETPYTFYVMHIHLPRNKDAEIWMDDQPISAYAWNYNETSSIIGTLESNSVDLEPTNTTLIERAKRAVSEREEEIENKIDVLNASIRTDPHNATLWHELYIKYEQACDIGDIYQIGKILPEELSETYAEKGDHARIKWETLVGPEAVDDTFADNAMIYAERKALDKLINPVVGKARLTERTIDGLPGKVEASIILTAVLSSWQNTT